MAVRLISVVIVRKCTLPCKGFFCLELARPVQRCRLKQREEM